MGKPISILDNDYLQWVRDLVVRYRQSQIKAAIKVNEEQLKFNWMLGRDIVEMKVEERWGESVIEQLSKDLKKEMPHVEGLSVTNLRYCRRFYLLYYQMPTIRPQLEGESIDNASSRIHPQVGGELYLTERSAELADIFKVPWGHHKLILDKVKGDTNKALFFINQTLLNGWSRVTGLIQGYMNAKAKQSLISNILFPTNPVTWLRN
jgi:predicted nuclease of restriction endonuclease-like (RecB) superfamily